MMATFRYKVMKQAFIDGSVHGPAEKRKYVTRDKKFSKDNKPSWLELVDEQEATAKIEAKSGVTPLRVVVEREISASDTEVI